IMKKLHEIGNGIVQAYQPSRMSFRIGAAKDERPRNLVELLQGNKMVFRYYLATGGYKDISFSLQGSAKAISAAIE
ncbi:MAG: hypothetical protein MI754_15965, partial [Chromatiales bacterium]|nr:hypothetical protein [Chromatiales bacterium]